MSLFKRGDSYRINKSVVKDTAIGKKAKVRKEGAPAGGRTQPRSQPPSTPQPQPQPGRQRSPWPFAIAISGLALTIAAIVLLASGKLGIGIVGVVLGVIAIVIGVVPLLKRD